MEEKIPPKNNNKKKKRKIKHHSIRDCWQITFGTFNGILSIKQPHSTPLFLTDKIKTDGMSTKINWKINTFFTLHSKFWRYFF